MAERNMYAERPDGASLRRAGEQSGLGDFVQVEWPCGHGELLTAAILATAGVAPDRKVLDLGRRMRCRECDERGRAIVSIRWDTSRKG
jgi:hypothetical protein